MGIGSWRRGQTRRRNRDSTETAQRQDGTGQQAAVAGGRGEEEGRKGETTPHLLSSAATTAVFQVPPRRLWVSPSPLLGSSVL
jgi:hypothetical protein